MRQKECYSLHRGNLKLATSSCSYSVQKYCFYYMVGEGSIFHIVFSFLCARFRISFYMLCLEVVMNIGNMRMVPYVQLKKHYSKLHYCR